VKFIAAFLFFVTSTLSAQTVELVVYSTLGNQSDTAARYFEPILEKVLGRPIVVVNQPGANGTIGMRYAKRTAESTDVILVGNASIGLASAAKQIDFDPRQQFIPLHGMSNGHAAIFVAVNSTVRSSKDFKDVYKKNGRLLVGTTGVIDEVTAMDLGRSLGIPVELIRYNSVPQLAAELSQNTIDLTIGTVGASTFQSFFDAGLLRAIAIIDSTRSPYMPNVPTLVEQGFTKVEGFRWTAFFVSASMPAEKRGAFAKAISRAMRSPEAAAYEKLPGLPQLFLKSDAEILEIQAAEQVVLAKQLKKIHEQTSKEKQ
jgi:tripartite-type tricarboxylate transporter receptor subunit TctC